MTDPTKHQYVCDTVYHPLANALADCQLCGWEVSRHKMSEPTLYQKGPFKPEGPLSENQMTAEQVLERWALPPELDEAGKAAMRLKAASTPAARGAFANMSDEWVADRVRMLMRRDIWHEAICCAGRDRIMNLSLEVERLKTQLEAQLKWRRDNDND